MEHSASQGLGERLAKPYLDMRRSRNTRVWENPRNWRLGFYFGYGDERLWVPRRDRTGAPRDSDRVINFGHPIGERAFPVLVCAYLIFAIIAVTLVAVLLGVRW